MYSVVSALRTAPWGGSSDDPKARAELVRVHTNQSSPRRNFAQCLTGFLDANHESSSDVGQNLVHICQPNKNGVRNSKLCFKKSP